MSLRDVERCMCVFEYFLRRKDLFCDHMNDKAKEEKKEVIKSLLVLLKLILNLTAPA